SELLARWVKRDIDFVAFRNAIRANPVLPKHTVEGMLATLPDAGDLVAEQGILELSRKAIAAATQARHRARSNEIALKAAGRGVAAVAIIAAAAMRTWGPLVGLAPLLLFPLLSIWMKRRRRLPSLDPSSQP